MPVLLDPARAPSLSELLRAVPSGLVQRVVPGIDQNADPRIAGLGSLANANSLEISFIVHPKYLEHLTRTQACAVIVLPEIEDKLVDSVPPPTFARVVCKHPYLLYARISQWFDWARQPALEPSIHPTAIVDASAEISPSVSVGPHVVIGARCKVGAMTQLGAGCVLGDDVEIGASSILYPRVCIYYGVKVGDRAILHSGVVLGADGFGFAPDPSLSKGAWGKIPQLGTVLIGNDVELGANTTIDRGALDNTIVEDGVKIDNHVMIGHNCKIGTHTAIAACVGIAGSTTIGARCTVGGMAGISGHLNIGDDVHISGGTGVIASISEPGRYTGVYPFAEHKEWQRNAAVISQLSSMRKRIRALERE
ncbi:UDP-3-O-(3-hydroxymyristoyl)glucosamine N-acyltransferase [Zwartia sp.]|uniref:UDP-3-O-(3-hydroxymyristoyl)glucosamine N-acyltransferase n=1 Tax=Zwartia sp. TaxID=2978004 RepID=UPI00271AF269|nr:UDP-3-O-(3-hydroxymyristoyl)glucosamine N-acyltransferase [Zwartia sp.]MDO9024362.1 UDP-3-O-(3-hydroxymyristoyl)glucosamine N-acyltransferase [Zwartia sp.]